MTYTSGMLKHRILVQNRKTAISSKYGIDGAGIEWEDACEVWASMDWAKGVYAMRVGALDAYAVVIVRCRWTDIITMRSRIVYQGQTYQILPDTFHADIQANTIQFHAQLIINDKAVEVPPQSTSEL